MKEHFKWDALNSSPWKSDTKTERKHWGEKAKQNKSVICVRYDLLAYGKRLISMAKLMTAMCWIIWSSEVETLVPRDRNYHNPSWCAIRQGKNIVFAAVLNTKKPLVIIDIFRMEKNSNTDGVWLVSVCLWGWKFRAQFSWHQHIKSEFSQNISVLKRNLFLFLSASLFSHVRKSHILFQMKTLKT